MGARNSNTNLYVLVYVFTVYLSFFVFAIFILHFYCNIWSRSTFSCYYLFLQYGFGFLVVSALVTFLHMYVSPFKAFYVFIV